MEEEDSGQEKVGGKVQQPACQEGTPTSPPTLEFDYRKKQAHMER